MRQRFGFGSTFYILYVLWVNKNAFYRSQTYITSMEHFHFYHYYKEAAFCSSLSLIPPVFFLGLLCTVYVFVSFCNVVFFTFSLFDAVIFGLLEHKTVSWPWLFPFAFSFIFFSLILSFAPFYLFIAHSLSRSLLSNRLHQCFSWWFSIWSNWHNFECYFRLLTIQRESSPVCQSPKHIYIYRMSKLSPHFSYRE